MRTLLRLLLPLLGFVLTGVMLFGFWQASAQEERLYDDLRRRAQQVAEGMEPVKHTPVDRGPWEERLMTAYRDNPLHQASAHADLHMIKAYDEMIDKLETQLLKITKRDAWKDFAIIQSVPGIGNILGLTILYELDTTERFPSVKDFSSYCRLVKGSQSHVIISGGSLAK